VEAPSMQTVIATDATKEHLEELVSSRNAG
jgi:hypothetical protein